MKEIINQLFSFFIFVIWKISLFYVLGLFKYCIFYIFSKYTARIHYFFESTVRNMRAVLQRLSLIKQHYRPQTNSNRGQFYSRSKSAIIFSKLRANPGPYPQSISPGKIYPLVGFRPNLSLPSIENLVKSASYFPKRYIFPGEIDCGYGPCYTKLILNFFVNY